MSTELDNRPAPIEQAKTTEITLAPLASAIVATGKVDAMLAKQYPEVIQAYEPFYAGLKAIEPKAKALKEQFDACESDTEKLTFADTAKFLRNEAMCFRTKGKGGVELVKEELKSVSDGYVKMYLAGFNVCNDFSKSLEADMSEIEKYEQAIIERNRKKLDADRKDQVAILGGSNFLLDGEDCASYTPEKWDERLGQIEGLIKLANFEQAERNRIEEAEALKAKADAEKQMIRTARGKQLHAVGAFYEDDLADLSEVEFMALLEKAQADKVEAERKRQRKRQSVTLKLNCKMQGIKL
jgi:hypothetical protein